jgi:hypothetical protein
MSTESFFCYEHEEYVKKACDKGKKKHKCEDGCCVHPSRTKLTNRRKVLRIPPARRTDVRESADDVSATPPLSEPFLGEELPRVPKAELPDARPLVESVSLDACRLNLSPEAMAADEVKAEASFEAPEGMQVEVPPATLEVGLKGDHAVLSVGLTAENVDQETRLEVPIGEQGDLFEEIALGPACPPPGKMPKPEASALIDPRQHMLLDGLSEPGMIGPEGIPRPWLAGGWAEWFKDELGHPPFDPPIG